MSGIILSGDTSGSVTLQPPAVAGSNTITVAAQTGTLNVAGPAFSAYATSGTTLSTGTWGKVGFQTVLFDTNSNYSTTNSRFTPTVAGYYQINTAVLFGTSGGAQQDAIAIYKNGTFYQIGPYVPDTGGLSLRCSMSSLIYCNGTTDYIEIWAVYNAGPSTQTLGSGASYNTWFTGCLVRGA